MQNVSIINDVAQISSEDGLALYHYRKDATHPGDADFWKGVVIDEHSGDIVARSFQWAPTVVTEVVPVEDVYTPYYEATVIRFYRHHGQALVGTHRQINITDKRSRVDTGRPFMELIRDSINAWEYSREEYPVASGEDEIPHEGSMGIAFTPSDWEDLCIEGFCNIFLLMDQSNQITDLVDLAEEYDTEEEGGVHTVRTVSPKLIHAMTLMQQDGAMIPVNDDIVVHAPIIVDDVHYSEYRLIVPKIERFDHIGADSVLSDGGAVVGFSPISPDVTVKYLSPAYDRKLKLAGETFNPVHRWFQLMDSNPEDAQAYLQHLPHHKKGYTTEYLEGIRNGYNEESIEFLSDIAIGKLTGNRHKYDSRVDTFGINALNPNARRNKGSAADLIRAIVNTIVSDLRHKHRGNLPKREKLVHDVNVLVTAHVNNLTHAQQHSVHGNINKIIAGR